MGYLKDKIDYVDGVLDTIDEQYFISHGGYPRSHSHAVIEAFEDARYWKQKYDEQINATLKHSQELTAGFLKAAVSGVFKAPEEGETK